MKERAETHRRCGAVEVGVRKHDHRRLAAEFEQHALEMLASLLGDDPPHLRGAGEVDPPRRRVCDQLIHDVSRILGTVSDQIDHAARKTRVYQRLDDRRVRAGADLGRLQDDRVGVRERGGERASAEDRGRVPGRYPHHHAGRRPDAHRQLARHVGRDHLANEPVRLGGCLSQHAGGQLNVEHSPAEDAAGLFGDDPGDLLLAFHEQVGSLAEDLAPHRRCAARPLGESGGGGLDRGARILAAGGGRRPNFVARVRERLTVGLARPGAGPLAPDQQPLQGPVGRRHRSP